MASSDVAIDRHFNSGARPLTLITDECRITIVTNGERVMGICNGMWRRIGDNAFGFGLQRFEDCDKQFLWRLRITKNPDNRMIEIDASISDLREIMKFCNEAIRALESDGGREEHPAQQAAEHS